MNKLTTNKYRVFGLNKANMTKVLAMAGIFYMFSLPSQVIADDAIQSAFQKPALLALADIRPEIYAPFNSDQLPCNQIFVQGSALAALANPMGIIKESCIQPDIKPSTNSNPSTKILTVKEGVIVTAYSSTPDQTDSSPFITAKGTLVRDGIVAANFLKFGTKVRFPEVYGDKIFVVEDRMAAYNSHKVDIWMESREAALQFGVRHLTLEIVE